MIFFFSGLFSVQDFCLAEFLRDQSSQVSSTSDPQLYKRQEAIWELFTSECVYFLDQLMVLKEVTVPCESLRMHAHSQTTPPRNNSTKPKKRNPTPAALCFFPLSLNSCE